MVKTKGKIILILCLVLFILLASIAGTLFYYYSHPAAVKGFIEKYISNSTGSAFSIEKLSYSIHPIRIHAEGIVLDPGDQLSGIRLNISQMSTEIRREGPLGHKILVFEQLTMNRFSFHVSQEVRLPKFRTEPKAPSAAGRLVAKLIAFLLFRDIRFQQAEITQGEASIQLQEQHIHLEGIQARLTPEHQVDISCSSRIEWPGQQLSFTAPHLNIVTDRSLSLSDPEIKASLTAKNATLKGPDVHAEGVAVKAGFTFNIPDRTLSFEPVDLNFEGVSLKDNSKKKSHPFDLSLQTKGDFALNERRLILPRFHLKARDLLEVTGGLKARLDPADPMNVEIRIEEIGLYKKTSPSPEKKLEILRPGNLICSIALSPQRIDMKINGHRTNLVKAARAYNRLPSGWEFGLLDSFELKATRMEKGSWSLTSQLDFEEINFQNEDLTYAGENMSVHAEAEGRLDPATLEITGTAGLKMDKGEALYDRFYMNVEKNPFSASFKGSYNISGKSLRLSNLTLGLKDILALDVSGIFTHKKGDERLRLGLRIPEIPLEPAFRHFVLGPFKTEKPFLKALKLGGKISADLDLSRKGKNWEASGHCRWDHGNLSVEDGELVIEGIELGLPVWYRTRKSKVPANHSRGSLSVNSLILPYLPEQSIHLQLDAGPNALFVKSPTQFMIPGGTVTLGPLTGENIFGPDLSIETSLALTAVEIDPLVSKILGHPIEGKITGRLDPIHFEHNILKTSGVIIAKAFDGEIVLSDLGASGLLTPSPVYKLSVLLKHLNLEKITTGTAFGKIEGILKGYVNDLEIAFGQPQKFELVLETVPEEGIRQVISLKAVDNIAQIGGGASPFRGLAGTFSLLFKEFPYTKIGIKASLENDVFRINGTNKKGGEEYLVERGRFSGVNIVNQNPDNRISFKDMVKRIQRVTSKGRGPVIK